MKKEYQATNYESDLTDEQWEAIKEFFPSGNKSKYHKRSLVEAVLYIVKTGCQWRMLPHDYPPHDTVWSFYRRARENGIWDKMMKHLVALLSIIYCKKHLCYRFWFVGVGITISIPGFVLFYGFGIQIR